MDSLYCIIVFEDKTEAGFKMHYTLDLVFQLCVKMVSTNDHNHASCRTVNPQKPQCCLKSACAQLTSLFKWAPLVGHTANFTLNGSTPVPKAYYMAH